MAFALLGVAAAWGQQPAEAGMPAPGGIPAMRINGFADVRFVSASPSKGNDGFRLGQFDLFVRSQLSEDVGMLSEVVITPRPSNQFRISLERLLVQYTPSDEFNVAAGRYHTAIGYYNAAYHHGTWFQVATGRPLIFAFEADGGILPIHTLGVSASGRIPSGRLGLGYILEVGNGRASESSPAAPPQPVLRDNRTKAINLGVTARPDWAEGLQAGVSYYHDRLTPDTLPSMREDIVAAHLLYRTSDVEWLNEAVMLRHRPGGGTGVAETWGFYAQLSRRFGRARPYVRYDYVDVPAADPVFGYLGRRQGPTIGLRLDVDPLAALKLQYNHTTQSARAAVDRLEAQLAFTF